MPVVFLPEKQAIYQAISRDFNIPDPAYLCLCELSQRMQDYVNTKLAEFQDNPSDNLKLLVQGDLSVGRYSLQSRKDHLLFCLSWRTACLSG